MVKHRTQELLRERDAARRARQLWLAGLVIWGAVVGWAAWGLVGMLADDSDLVAWLAYVIPLVVLAVGSATAWARVSRIDRELVADAETEARP